MILRVSQDSTLNFSVHTENQHQILWWSQDLINPDQILNLIKLPINEWSEKLHQFKTHLILLKVINDQLIIACQGHLFHVAITRIQSDHVLIDGDNDLHVKIGKLALGDLIKIKYDQNHADIHVERIVQSTEVKPSGVIVNDSEIPKVINKPTHKQYVLFGIFLLFVLFTSVYVGGTKKINELWLTKINNLSVNIKPLCNLPDKNLALEKISTYQFELDKIASESPKKFIDKINLVKSLNQTTKDCIVSNLSISTIPIWFDLSLIKPNLIGSNIIDGQKLIIHDSGSSTLLTIDKSSKKSEILAGPDQIANLPLSASSGRYAWVLGLNQIKGFDQVSSKLIELTPMSFENISIVSGFGGNLYIFNQIENRIYRLAGINGVLENPASWLSDTASLPNDVIDFTVSSDVYVLTAKSTIKRYRRGSQINFKLNQVTGDPLQKPTKISVHTDSNTIALLEPSKSRVIFFDNTGAYLKTLSNSIFTTARQLVFDQSSGDLFVLSSGLIYKINPFINN